MGAARSRSVVLDTGALIQLDRGDPKMRALIRLASERAASLIVPAGVLAQAWRDASRQVALAALVNSRMTEVDALDETAAKAIGVVCGRTGVSDVIDASVVLAARQHDAVVVTSDAADLRRIDAAVVIRTL